MLDSIFQGLSGSTRGAKREFLFGALLISICFGYSQVGSAAEAIGNLGSVVGKAQIVRNGATVAATRGMEVFASDKLVTAEKTAVKINFKDGGNFIAFENSTMTIDEYKSKKEDNGTTSLKSAFDIAKGKVRFFVKPQTGAKVDAKYRTPNAVMGIRGTSGFIDATDPKRTQLVVLTGKVEISNPLDPSKSVMVPPNFMTDVVGSSVPTAPKEAPPAMLNSINSQSTKVDPSVKPSSEAAPAGQQGSNEKKSDGDQQAAGEKKSDGDKPAAGEKKSDGDQQASGEKKSDGDKPAAGEKKSDGDKQVAGDKKSDSDKPAAGEKKSDGDKQSASGDKKSGDKPAAAGDSKQPASGGDQQGNNTGPSKNDGPAAGPAGEGGAKGNASAGKGNGPNGPNGPGGAGPNNGPAGAPPKPFEKTTVYSPDGSSGVVVNDVKFDQLKTAVVVPVNVAPTASTAAINNQLQEVKKATKTTEQIKEVNQQINQIQQTKINEQQTSRTVKVRITTPN